MTRQILIVDANPFRRLALKRHVAQSFHRPLIADSLDASRRVLRQVTPDLLLINLKLPDGSGLALLRELRASQQIHRMLRVAIAPAQCPEIVIEAFAAGADEVITLPLDPAMVAARLRNMLRQYEVRRILNQAWGGQLSDMLGMAEAPEEFSAPPNLTLIGCDADRMDKLRHKLPARLQPQCRIIPPPEAETDLMQNRGTLPNLFLIDNDLPQAGDGLALMARLLNHGSHRKTAYGLLTRPPDRASARMALELGVNDILHFDMSEAELAARISLMLDAQKRLAAERRMIDSGLRMALVDPLTGAYNRRCALPKLVGISRQAIENGTDFAVMVVDLDRFKLVNDRHGHTIGDLVLVEVVQRLSAALRCDDVLARLGGEEFLILLPGCSLPEAQEMAERLRRAVADQPIRLPGNVRNRDLQVTVSIGLTILSPQEAAGHTAEAMIERADMALRQSKRSGRNLVSLSTLAASPR